MKIIKNKILAQISKLKLSGIVISEEEKEDFGLLLMMSEVDTSIIVPREKIINKLRK